jgi:pseudaminic acid cytidylyltransferase
MNSMIAVIPARGGSKRIPQKNLKDFMGAPIVAHTVRSAIESSLFEAVFVSTENSDIADIALANGAKVIRRSLELSDDFTDTSAVLKDSMVQLKNLTAVIPELVCCIYPVTPLLNYNRISEAVNLLENNCDFVIPVLPHQKSATRAFSIDSVGLLKNLIYDVELGRTQDDAKSFYDAGQFYLGRKEAWEKGVPIFSSRSKALILSKYEVVDVDDLEDWEFMTSIYTTRNKT